MTESYRIEFIRRVPVVDKDGARWILDIGAPCSYPHPGVAHSRTSQEFHGIPGLRTLGMDGLRRYTLIDYANARVVTSDEPIDACGPGMPVERPHGWAWQVPMEVGGIKGNYVVDTGVAYAYVHGLGTYFPRAGEKQDVSFQGDPWTIQALRVPAMFDGIDFEVVGAPATENAICPNGGAVPRTGIVGYDFFKAFTVVIDKVGNTLAYVPAAAVHEEGVSPADQDDAPRWFYESTRMVLVLDGALFGESQSQLVEEYARLCPPAGAGASPLVFLFSEEGARNAGDVSERRSTFTWKGRRVEYVVDDARRIAQVFLPWNTLEAVSLLGFPRGRRLEAVFGGWGGATATGISLGAIEILKPRTAFLYGEMQMDRGFEGTGDLETLFGLRGVTFRLLPDAPQCGPYRKYKISWQP